MLIQPLKLERIEIAIADLPDFLVGLKLIHLSDLHYDGKSLTEKLLLETIEKSNQENPDLIFLTGDYVTKLPNVIYNLIPHLKYLKSRYGIYACLGNHDLVYRHGKKMIIDALRSIKINVLYNETVYLFQDKLAIIGLPDFWAKDFNPALVFPSIKPDIPRIVLSHNPDTAEILQKYRVDLQLSGHTHGGQIIIPILGPIPAFLFKIRKYIPPLIRPFIPYMKECSKIIKHWEWSQGYQKIGTNQLYVNRGLGAYFPGRLFCPPELTIITLIKL